MGLTVYGENLEPSPTPVLKKNIIQSFFDFITSPIRSIANLFNRNDNNNQGKENSSQTVEVPTQIPTPSFYYIPPTIDPDPVIDCNFTYIGTLKLRRSVCTRSTDCQINGKWIYYDSVDKCKQDQNSVNRQNSPNNNVGNNNVNQINSGSIKIKCSYSDSSYQFDFGELTNDECTAKSNEYWANERQKISNSNQNNVPTSVPQAPSGKSQVDIQKCKDDARAKYEDLIRGCYIRFQDSAANACARGYQGMSGTEIKQCEN